VTQVSICSEINTKYTHRVWQNIKFLNVNLVGASLNQ